MSFITLDMAAADSIVVSALKYEYQFVKKRIDETDVLSIQPHQLEDYTYDVKLLKAMEIVLKYYGEEL